MRGVLIYYNAIVALGFAGFLGYTFFARSHLDSAARDFVTEKTVQHSRPIVDAAEEVLKSKAAQILLPKDLENAMHDQIASYRREPASYIAELTGKRALLKTPEDKNELVRKILGWKQSVVDYYDKVLRGLVVDLRVFAVTNIAAACAACWFAYRAEEQNHNKLILVSGILLASSVLCSLQYYDDLTFFKIITNSYAVSAYPLSLAAMFIWMYVELEPISRSTPDSSKTA